SSPVSAAFRSRGHALVQMKVVPNAIPGSAARMANKAMRLSKRSRVARERRGVRAGGWDSPPELESIPFHPAIQGPAAQAQRLCGLAHVAMEALQRFADENFLDLLDAEFFEVLALRTLLVQAQIGNLDLAA